MLFLKKKINLTTWPIWRNTKFLCHLLFFSFFNIPKIADRYFIKKTFFPARDWEDFTICISSFFPSGEDSAFLLRLNFAKTVSSYFVWVVSLPDCCLDDCWMRSDMAFSFDSKSFWLWLQMHPTDNTCDIDSTSLWRTAFCNCAAFYESAGFGS